MHHIIAHIITLFALMTLPTLARADGVRPERLARLARGVNLSHWYAQSTVGHYKPEHLDRWTTRQDADRIRALGFTYVRLPFDPKLIWTDVAAPDKLDPRSSPASTRPSTCSSPPSSR